MVSAIVASTIQACVLSATGNLLAQAITAYKKDAPFSVDWKLVFQFVLYTILSTPPNMLWQYFLEATFPSTYTTPSRSAVDAASKSNEAELDREEKTHKITESHLSIRSLVMKMLLDQTVGAVINTLLYSLTFAGFHGVGYAEAWGAAKAEFWPLMTAGWKFWPLVGFVNFSVLKSVEARNLMGSLAGLLWGIFVSLKRV